MNHLKIPLILLLLTTIPTTANPTLKDYRWKNRVLLLFGNPTSDKLQNQKAILATDPDGLADRDMVILEPPQTKTLAKRYKVDPKNFTVILVGKDGGEKLRQEEPATLDQLFGLIDQMPMRQQEMRR